MFINNRPDALGLIGRAAGQPQQPVQSTGSVASRSPAPQKIGGDDADQMKFFLSHITRADPTALLELTEQSSRNNSKASYDSVVSAYGEI